MGSTNSYQGINPHSATTLTAVPAMSVQGFYTSASAITGGVTTSDVGHSHGVKLTKTNENDPEPGGNPHDCGCQWVPDGNGGYRCPNCGATWDGDEFDNSTCKCDPCRCPLDMNWGVVLFMVALATVYAYIKKTNLTPNSDVRNGRDMLA